MALGPAGKLSSEMRGKNQGFVVPPEQCGTQHARIMSTLIAITTVPIDFFCVQDSCCQTLRVSPSSSSSGKSRVCQMSSPKIYQNKPVIFLE